MIPRPFETRSAEPGAQHRRGRPPGAWMSTGLLAAASLAGCADDAPDAQRTGENPAVFGPRPWATEESWWSVTLEDVSEPDLYLTFILDIDVDSRGRVFLVDGGEGGITVLTPVLGFLQTVGREGQGPGEFDVRQVQILPGDTLFVYDAGLGRITLFDPDNLEVVATVLPPDLEQGSVSRLWKLPDRRRFFALDRLPFVAGESVAGDEGRSDVLLAFDESSGIARDTLVIVPSPEWLVVRQRGFLSVARQPFGREPLVQVLGEDRIAYANSGALDVTVLDFEGTTVRAFSHPTTPIPVTSTELRAEIEEMSEPMADLLRSGAPYTWPALVGLVTDDEERIWVGIRGPGGSSDWEWAVFAPDGTHVGSILLPAGHLLQVVRDDRLYAVSHDELDVPSIQAYRIRVQDG